ncbi:MAG: YraN family protein [Candidatus Peregrinibacteria bacterium]
MNKQSFGKQGEKIAIELLKNKGYQILETNFHKRSGEIDIIAKSPEGQYVFIEVKTRHGHGFGYPEEAVNPQKIRKIFTTAQTWLAMKKIETENYRIDVIAIEYEGDKPKIIHLENIF